jgi:D-glycero-D-manno-heptose 1,7-bisphosphate phosphatase
MKTPRAVFLDRDGTLSEDVGYLGDFRQVHIYGGAFEAVRRLRVAGFAAVVVTNQSGIGRGYFDEEDLRALHGRFLETFARRGAALDGLYHCPHVPGPSAGSQCACAKPRPGLAIRAAGELGLKLRDSYMIGDKAEDILFGLNIGAVPILVLTGYGRKSRRDLAARGIRPAHVAAGVLEAATWILEHGRPAGHDPF